MWRFVTGAKAPKEKEKQSENEHKEYQASYEFQKESVLFCHPGQRTSPGSELQVLQIMT